MVESPKSEGSIEIFCSYSHADEDLRDEFERALALLRRRFVQIWHDRRITPGKNWKGEIDEHLKSADIIVLLVSADFLASDYCYETEMAMALDRARKQEAVVVPIIVRPCVWEDAPFARLQAIPDSPITTWENRDAAWTSVAKSLANIVRETYAREKQRIEDQMAVEQEAIGSRIAHLAQGRRDQVEIQAIRDQLLRQADVQSQERQRVKAELQWKIRVIDQELLSGLQSSALHPNIDFHSSSQSAVSGTEAIAVPAPALQSQDMEDKRESPLSKFAVLTDKILSWADYLAHLQPDELFDRILATLVAICSAVAAELLLRGLWLGLLAAVAVGSSAMFVLVQRRRRATGTPGKPRQQLTQRQRYSVLSSFLLVLAVVLGFSWHLVSLYQGQSRAAHFYHDLNRSGLPKYLYDHRNQIESLVIDQSDRAAPNQAQGLTDLDWLESSSLTDLAIASPKLKSLSGLAGVPGLRSLSIDLNHVSMPSLGTVSLLHRLQSLTLKNTGRAQSPLVLELSAFSELRNLDLDFKNSPISSIPDLASCQQLESLALDLRSTAKILDLPDLSGFPQLRSVSLLLDYSRVQRLATLGNLDSLRLSLDGTQVPLLAALRNGRSLHALNLAFATPPNDPFPDLSGIQGLISLTLYMPGERGVRFRDGTALPDRTSVPDITNLTQLQELAIHLNGSDVQELPAIGRMIALRNLYLDLPSSGIERLPDISQLRDLDRLMLNVNDTNVRDFPDLSRFPRLRYLNLGLAGSRNTSPLHGIEALNALEVLELDLRRSSIQDISAILSLNGLKTLVLHLGWEQVRELPNLARLRNLTTLVLQLDGWWSFEELPSLSGLQSLEQISLGLEGAHIKKIPDFSGFSHLWKVTLNLESSDVDDLSSLADIAGLKELSLDLQHTGIKAVPNLAPLKNLQRATADIRHSAIDPGQLENFSTLEELIVDKNFLMLRGLPKSVKKLTFSQ